MTVYKTGFTSQEIPEDIRKNMTGKTYHENNNITLDDLSYLNVKYYNFKHEVENGELIVSEKLAEEVLDIFYQLFKAEYEIEKMKLADFYNGDDDKIMADNNTSAFNYRVVADTNTVSMHGYGRAIDINPLINPYIVGKKVMPSNAVQYCDRELAFPHKIDHDDICYKIFIAHGWKWGGDWVNSKDYQHFYKDKKQPVKAVLRRIRGVFKK